MATGYCRNDDCGREDWPLTKHPTEYAGGWPTCPDCGTTNIEVEGADAHQAPQRGQAPPQQPQQGQRQAQPPAAQQPQESAQAPAVPDDQAAMAQGAQMADMLLAVQSDDPQQQATATGRLLKMVGSAAAQYGDHMEKRQAQRNQRARETGDGDIRVASEYPECPECHTQITQIPGSGEFACPGCGVRLEPIPGE